MRIVQINAVYGVGSTGRIVQDIAGVLRKQGHETYVFWAIQCREDENAQFIRVGNTLDHKLHAFQQRLDGKQGWHSKAATRKACREIAALKPDVVHLHNLHSNYIHLPELLKFLGEHQIPTLITLHDSWMYTCGFCNHHFYFECDGWMKGCIDCPAAPAFRGHESARMYREKSNLYNQIDRLAVNGVSQWTTQEARRSMLRSAGQFCCIYNWVDTNLFCPQTNTNEVRRKYGIPCEHKLILGVSQSWSAEKGLVEFLQIAEELCEHATVILVGKDSGIPQRDNLRCIGFTNNRQELVELYSAADLLLNPSRAETFGLVTAEAMACGTPVVAYDNTGASELVAPQCGALAPDGDTEVLKNLAKKVLQDGKTAYESACRQWVLDNFEKEKQIQKYVDTYSQMIKTYDES